VLADDKVGGAEAARCVASALHAYVTLLSSDVLASAAMALRALLNANLPGAAVAFEDATGVDALCGAMRVHARVPYDVPFQIAIIALLELLQKEKSGKRVRRAADAGAFGLLAGALNEPGALSALGVRACVRCLGVLLDAPGTVTRASEARVLETVVAAMLRAPNDAVLQQHGAWALHAAAATNSLIVGADADRRAMILALLDAMRAHAADAETLHVCLVTLSSISVEDDLERLAGSMGAHSAILEVVASHASDEEMMEAALTLMRNLSLMPEGKLAAGLCGSVEAVVRVLTRHAHSERVATRACAALAALVLDSTNEAVAGRCGALPAIITALRTHGS
jgi:uncharacterized membrane protein YecN with MAPEG domain